MSIYPSIRVWDHSRQRGSYFVLLLAMADRADELGVCWAGTNWLAGRARLERRQVIRIVQQLEQQGEIIVVRSRRPNGQNVVNHYIVAVATDEQTIEAAHERVRELIGLRGGSVIDDTSVTEDTTPSVTEDTTPSVTEDTTLVSRMSPDPYSYPIEEGGHIFSSPDSLWDAALDEIEMQIARATYNQWFIGSKALSLDEDVLTVQVKSQFAVEWLSTRLNGIVENTVISLLGRPVTIRYEAKS